MDETTRMNLDHKLNAPLDSLIKKKDNRDKREKRVQSDGVEACRDHLRGNCTRGASCPFSHTAPKEPCRAFQRGDCPRGKECPYSHKVPKDICRDFLLRSDCSRGRDCPYKHPKKRTGEGSGVRDSTPRDSGASQGGEVCRDYLRGECERGHSCPYLHSDNVVPVCKDYVRGDCNRGDTCPYHHIVNFKSTGAETCRNFQKPGGCTRGVECPYVEICRDAQRGHCPRGLICPFHHSQLVASPSSSKRRRDDEPERGSRSRYSNVDVGSLIEESILRKY